MSDLAGRPHNDLLIDCLGVSVSILEVFFSSFHDIHAKTILAKYSSHLTISIIGTMEIYVAKSDQQTGPFSEQQIESMLNSGMIVLTDLAWHAGLSDWVPLHQVLKVSAPMALPAKPPLLGAPMRATARATQLASPSATESHDSSVASVGPKGVGGWLVFFCIGLTILSPLLVLGQMVSTWKASEGAFGEFPEIKTAMLWENFGSIMLLIYGFIVGCIIWSGNPQGRSIARQFLLIRLFGFIGIELSTLLMMSGLPSNIVAGGVRGVGGAVFNAGIYFLVWWSYFKKSKRVKNTYGDELA